MSEELPVVAASPEDRLAEVQREMPRIQREFRAAWVATVDNIDWPSEPGLSSEAQQAEMLELLDRAVMMNLNAIIFQIRPIADALYPSEYEPWSYYLSGSAGVPPNPYYDPLAFTIEEAHKRGLELHAWINPYRAFHPTASDTLAVGHVSELYPNSVHRYGEQMWMDPGSEKSTEHSLAVILDVVERYDIDGIHLDDYFYPYAVNDAEGKHVEFPDSAFYAQSGDDLSRGDWRRRNVDNFVETLYSRIKVAKPWVLFGISPFGIWRPGFPQEVTGFDAYDNLYADARKWLREGWVDYFTPQLYWKRSSEGQPYGPLLEWWIEQNEQNRHIWPGNFTSRIILEGASHWEPEEVVAQVQQTRDTSGATGNVHFSMRAIMPADHGMGNALMTGVYSKPAIAPRTTWLGGHVPAAPHVELHSLAEEQYASFSPSDESEVRNWIVHIEDGSGWQTLVVPGWRRALKLAQFEDARSLVVRAVTRLGLESEPTIHLIR